MPRLGDIAKIVLASDESKKAASAEKIIFPDTSFIVAFDQHQLWAMILYSHLEKKDALWFTLYDVSEEVNGFYEEKKRDRFGTLKVATDYAARLSSESTLLIQVTRDCERIAMLAWEKYSRKDGRIRPSDTDIKIMVAALSHALNGGESTVISADRDITKTIDSIVQEYTTQGAQLKLKCFSPNKIPEEEDFYKEPLMAITPKAIDELLQTTEAENRNFLSVAKDINLGGHTIDVGLYVHTKQLFTDKLPKIDGIKYLPIYYTRQLKQETMGPIARKIRENGRVVVKIRKGDCVVYDYESDYERKATEGTLTQTFTPVRIYRTDSTVKPFWTPELDRLAAMAA